MFIRILTLSIVSLSLLSCGGGSGSEDNSSSNINTSTGTSTLEPAVVAAIQTGDAFRVENPQSLIDATLDTISTQRTAYQSIKRQLLQLNTDGSPKRDSSILTSLTWDVTHDAAQLQPTFGINDTVLISNASHNNSDGERAFGVIGKVNSNGNQVSNYLVLGSNPMRTWQRGFAINEQMQQWLQNSIGWLAGRTDFDETPLKVRIAHMSNGYYFPDQSATRNWLDTYYPGQVEYNTADSCNGAALSLCVQEQPDILIISQEKLGELATTTVTNAITEAQTQGTSILYLHTDGHMSTLGNAILDHFSVTYTGDNYWRKYFIQAQDMSSRLNDVPNHIEQINKLISTLSQSSITFDWTQCSGEDCSAVPGFNTQFMNGANAVRQLLRTLDLNKKHIFSEVSHYQLEKLLVLLGDHFRSNIQYPMSKDETPIVEFLRAMYADMAVFNLRKSAPVPNDLGNFSRTDFSHITPTSQTVSMTSKRYFRAAGVYALPGQTVTITRHDNTNVTTKVFINSVRSGSTHWLANNGSYNRPKYLQSPHIEIQPGETLSLTSPYGGPIQLEFGENDHDVSFTFQNIGLHPYWKSSADNQTFEEQLAANDYDWSELSTAGFEVHSKTNKMVNSITNWGGTPADMAQATERYVSNLPHVLAGFQGPGIDVISEIHDFAQNNGFTVENIDIVKHMNADQPTCGWGCSGNPYDAGWDFSPIGHGDIHELGHGLERSRFRFEGWPVHASTNPYSYHSKYRYFLDTGNEPGCQSLPFESLFSTLQTAQSQSDPVQYVKDQNLTSWSQGAAIYIQMMMAAQAQGALQDGWMLLPRLHILEREYNAALNSTERWESKRSALGYSTYSLSEANNISKNDWLNISLSKVIGLNVTNYLAMWGLDAGTKAQQQVMELSLPTMSNTFYASGGAEFCKGLDKPAVAIDGSTAWPL